MENLMENPMRQEVLRRIECCYARYTMEYQDHCKARGIDYRCTSNCDIQVWLNDLNDSDLLDVYIGMVE